MKNRLPSLLISLFLILMTSYAAIASEVSGSILSDTTWTANNGDIIVTGTVTVPLGKTLMIEPGTVIKFASGTSLLIAGKIIASGTSNQPITFTSNSGLPSPGDWNGIEFQNTANVGSTFDYCNVLYGGNGANASNIYFKTGAFSINMNHVLSTYSSNHGINLRASSPQIKHSVFSENTDYGVYSDLFSSYNLDSCTVSNNGNGIRVPVNSTPTITHTKISLNGTGIFIDNSAVPVIKFNDIHDNSIGLQFISLGAKQPTIATNNFFGNTVYAVKNTGTQTLNAENNYWNSNSGPFHPTLNPTGKGDNVSNYVDFQPWNITSATLPVKAVSSIAAGMTIWWPDTVYQVTGTPLNIGNGKTLLIKPGTIVKLSTGNYIYPNGNGSLVAKGTNDSLIVFTSIKDDSYGGDSNNDGTSTGPNSGDWHSIYLYNNSANSSITNSIIKFAGNSNYTIYVESSAPTFKNLFMTNSKNDGFNLYNSTVTIDSVNISSSGRYGIYLNSNSTLTLTNSVITSNGSDGVRVNNSGTQKLLLVDHCNISFNGGTGIYSANSSGNQIISNNTLEGNSWGMWLYNTSGTNTIQNNIVKDNIESGITTSAASIQNNTITGNKYPICLTGKIEYTYSGNSISGNTYNNTIAIYANNSWPIKGHLTTDFPSAITSKAYTIISDIRLNLADTLTIDPGVILKFNKFSVEVYGKLFAEGTEQSPIIFTSYRDANYGGKTNLVSDNTLPAPGDWYSLNVYGNSSNNGEFSKLKNIKFRFGGANSGTLYLDYSVMQTPIENISIKKSANSGIYVYYSTVTFNSVKSDSNGSYGIRLYGDQGTEATVTNSEIIGNNSTGLNAENTSAFRQISNCVIQNNNGHGINVNNGNIPQTYYGNNISNNSSDGIVNYSPSIAASDFQIIGNTIHANLSDGVATTRAKFIDNTISNNRYPILIWGKTGNKYTDNNGSDGNVISGNTYNNTIALFGDNSHPLSDTLTSNFPVQIPSKVYTVLGGRVNNGDTFVIEAGTILKFNSNIEFDVYGKFVAKGTAESPIVFTSYRDSKYGGKTNLISDNTLPAPGDWRYLYIYSNGYNSTQSVIENCVFKFGGNGGSQLYLENFTLQNPIKKTIFRKSSTYGVYFYYAKGTLDSCVVDSNSSYGVRLYSNSFESEVNVKNSKIANNGNIGLYAENNSSFREVSNTEISGNNGTGIHVNNSNIPQSYIGNKIHHNLYHGIYSFTKNDAVDTLLMIAGNKIYNNGLTGILTSRALIIDDSISGNRYPIGITGQVSKSGINADGNFYSGNEIANNTFNNVISMEGNFSGNIGYSYPNADGWVMAPRGDVRVLNGDSVFVKPGTILKFPVEYGSGQFRVDGKMIAQGTANNKIVFTSFNDDTYGGDTNNDSTATVPLPGSWWGIYLYSGQNNNSKLKNVIARYGGKGSNITIFIESNTASVDSCFISYSNNYGIYLYNSNSNLYYNEIHHNNYGVYLVSSSNPVLRYNNFHDNLVGLYNNTSNTISAINNYWGNATGPYVNQGSDQNLSGLGNSIFLNTGAVTYRPYLTSRTGVLIGDVTENGTITAYDAAYLLQYLVSLRTLSQTAVSAADVSGDGTVSAFDASLILQYTIGKITGFPSLGKIAASSAVASVETQKTEQFIDIVFNLKNTQHLLASEVTLSFNPTYLKLIDVVSDLPNQGATTISNKLENKVKFAMASSENLASNFELVTIRFEILQPIRSRISDLLNVESLKLNENETVADLNKTDLSETISELPKDFALLQNYPNPFNPTTTIWYQLPVDGKIRLSIYNTLGQQITTLVDDSKVAGFYTSEWNGKDQSGKTVASGIYFYRIEIQGYDNQKFVSVKRMIMMK